MHLSSTIIQPPSSRAIIINASTTLVGYVQKVYTTPPVIMVRRGAPGPYCLVCKAYYTYSYYLVLPAVRRRLVILTRSRFSFGRITKLQLTRSYYPTD